MTWLADPPADFREKCLALAVAHEDLGKQITTLASCRLDTNQMRRLSTVIDAAHGSGHDLSPLSPFRLGVVGNGTMALLTPAFVASAARHGVALEPVVADFNQTVQEALNPTSRVNCARPDAVLVAIDFRGLPLACPLGDYDASATAVRKALEHITTIRDGFRRSCGAPCLLQTLVRPPESLFGSHDLQVPGTTKSLIDSFNRQLVDLVEGSGDDLLDVASLAEVVGLERWHDPVMWHVAKLPFAQALVPLYADFVTRRIAALSGKSRRCLVLDLDNTIWGGVIGDDGLDGIVLGQGDPAGEAYLTVQRAALALRERGVVLAVSSKNDDEIARLPFRQHPEMLLKEHHVAVFQANWQDKASNIKAIAETLSLGLDAFVLLDDNPAERALVRQALPQVAVPELPEDPALFSRALLMAGYFEATTFSREDRIRASFYEENAKRVALHETIGNLDDYLCSLEMRLTLAPFDSLARARITQLIHKTNQFNLTTQRYNETQVANFETDPAWFTMQARLMDRFGDNGMIAVTICHKEGVDWVIDNWLMSCRVLGRRVEEAVFDELVRQAKAEGARRLIGTYHRTARNALVEDHYPKLGFTPLEQTDDGQQRYTLDLAKADARNPPIAIDRSRLEDQGTVPQPAAAMNSDSVA